MKKIIFSFILLLFFASHAEALTASYYTYESAKASGDLGIMANGKKMDNNSLTCACWNYPLGTRLKVTNIENSKYIFVSVTDRGPNKRFVKRGRVIDLSKKAFEKIADLKLGIIKVNIEVVK